MPGKNIAVFGIYPHRASFEYACVVLKEQGFRATDVSVLLQENPGTKDLATKKSTKSPEGAATGAGSGAVIGGALGWLELARFLFPRSGHSSWPVPLLRHWRELELVVCWEGFREHC